MPYPGLSALKLPANTEASLSAALTHARNLIRNETPAFWKDTTFSLKKAYVAAVLSEIAYLSVPDFELSDLDQIKIVPCDTWQHIALTKQRLDVINLLQSGEFGETFVLDRYRNVIVVGIRTERLVFVAIRGTYKLYKDLPRDLDARPIPLRPSPKNVWFHSGFVEAFAECANDLSVKLSSYAQQGIPLYVTGHSLGAAMAAIMHAFWTIHKSAAEIQVLVNGWAERPHSAYTFAMPRYGSKAAMASIRQPFHIFRRFDPIPYVPTQWAGYANCTNEYESLEDAIRLVPSRGGMNPLVWPAIFVPGLFFKLPTHKIEKYRKRVGRAAGY